MSWPFVTAWIMRKWFSIFVFHRVTCKHWRLPLEAANIGGVRPKASSIIIDSSSWSAISLTRFFNNNLTTPVWPAMQAQCKGNILKKIKKNHTCLLTVAVFELSRSSHSFSEFRNFLTDIYLKYLTKVLKGHFIYFFEDFFCISLFFRIFRN